MKDFRFSISLPAVLRLPEAANDDGVAWPLILFPDGWHAAC